MNVRENRDRGEFPDSPAGTRPVSKTGAPATQLRVEEIASHPRLIPCIRKQAATLLGIQATNPRISSVFATQQRWLIAHMALAHYFREAGPGRSGGLHAARFIHSVATPRLASRNTADAV